MFELVPTLLATGFILLGILMVLFGFSSLEFFFRIKRKGIGTKARVERIDVTVWGVRPVMSFQDRQGKEIVAMPKNVKRGKNTMYREGDNVVIYYMADDPQTFIADAHLWEIIFVLLIMVIGACVSLATIFSLIFG